MDSLPRTPPISIFTIVRGKSARLTDVAFKCSIEQLAVRQQAAHNTQLGCLPFPTPTTRDTLPAPSLQAITLARLLLDAKLDRFMVVNPAACASFLIADPGCSSRQAAANTGLIIDFCTRVFHQMSLVEGRFQIGELYPEPPYFLGGRPKGHTDNSLHPNYNCHLNQRSATSDLWYAGVAQYRRP